jgi:hypothetical protein
MGEKHPDITFIHIYPGVVDTPILRFQWFVRLVVGIIRPLLRKAPDAGQFLLYPLLNSDFDGGAYFLGENAQLLSLGNSITDELTNNVWEHSLKRAQVDE